MMQQLLFLEQFQKNCLSFISLPEASKGITKHKKTCSARWYGLPYRCQCKLQLGLCERLSDAEWCWVMLLYSADIHECKRLDECLFNMWNYVKRLCFMLMFQKLRSELELFRLCFESIVSICFNGADDTKASQSPVDAMPASPTGHHDAMGNSERIRKDPKGSQRVAVCKCL